MIPYWVAHFTLYKPKFVQLDLILIQNKASEACLLISFAEIDPSKYVQVRSQVVTSFPA